MSYWNWSITPGFSWYFKASYLKCIFTPEHLRNTLSLFALFNHTQTHTLLSCCLNLLAWKYSCWWHFICWPCRAHPSASWVCWGLLSLCLCPLVVLFQELRNAHSEEIMGIRREEEMEMSDDDSDEIPCKRIRTEENGIIKKYYQYYLFSLLKLNK